MFSSILWYILNAYQISLLQILRRSRPIIVYIGYHSMEGIKPTVSISVDYSVQSAFIWEIFLTSRLKLPKENVIKVSGLLKVLPCGIPAGREGGSLMFLFVRNWN